MLLPVFKRKNKHKKLGFLQHYAHMLNNFFFSASSGTQAFSFDPQQPDYSLLLPLEIWIEVLKWLDCSDIGNIAALSQHFRAAAVLYFRQYAIKVGLLILESENIPPLELGRQINAYLCKKEQEQDFLLKAYPEWIIDLLGGINNFHQLPEKRFPLLPIWMSPTHVKGLQIIRGIEGFNRPYLAFALQETKLLECTKKNKVFILTFGTIDFCIANFNSDRMIDLLMQHQHPAQLHQDKCITFRGIPTKPLLYKFIQSLCKKERVYSLKLNPLTPKNYHIVELEDQSDFEEVNSNTLIKLT